MVAPHTNRASGGRHLGIIAVVRARSEGCGHLLLEVRGYRSGVCEVGGWIGGVGWGTHLERVEIGHAADGVQRQLGALSQRDEAHPGTQVRGQAAGGGKLCAHDDGTGWAGRLWPAGSARRASCCRSCLRQSRRQRQWQLLLAGRRAPAGTPQGVRKSSAEAVRRRQDGRAMRQQYGAGGAPGRCCSCAARAQRQH